MTTALDDVGDVVERYQYTPYGKVTYLNPNFTVKGTQSSSVGNEILYTGQRLDAYSGLYQYRHRYYHAQLGRFVNRDPIGYLSGDANLYGYVGGMPTFYADPLGLNGVIPDWIQQALGATPGQPISQQLLDAAQTANHTVASQNPMRPEFYQAAAQNAIQNINDMETVYANTEHMGSLQRCYVVSAVPFANATGVKPLSDAFHTHDAWDGHIQSTDEMILDGVGGGLTLVCTATGFKGGLRWGLQRTSCGRRNWRFWDLPCFPPGTLVLMADGSTKKIEEIEPGDEVLADDPENDEKPKGYKVTARSKNWTKRLIHIDIDQDGDGKSDAHYRATGKHPIWTAERGWQFAVDLKIGDELLTDRLEKVRVIGVQEEKVVIDTYNLSVAGVHTFYIVEDELAVLVHNATILLPGDGGLPYHGGTYGGLGTAGNGTIDRHHFFADSISGIPTQFGPAIQMDAADHALTASYLNRPGAAEYRALQSEMSFYDAVEMDIRDIRTKFGTKYDDAIREAVNGDLR